MALWSIIYAFSASVNNPYNPSFYRDFTGQRSEWPGRDVPPEPDCSHEKSCWR